MRKRLKLLSRSLFLAAWLVAVFAPSSVFAQPGKNAPSGGAGIPGPQEQTEPNWVFPYFLVVLGTGLGIWILGKPTRRKNPDEKDEGLA